MRRIHYKVRTARTVRSGAEAYTAVCELPPLWTRTMFKVLLANQLSPISSAQNCIEANIKFIPDLCRSQQITSTEPEVVTILGKESVKKVCYGRRL